MFGVSLCCCFASSLSLSCSLALPSLAPLAVAPLPGHPVNLGLVPQPRHDPSVLPHLAQLLLAPRVRFSRTPAQTRTPTHSPPPSAHSRRPGGAAASPHVVLWRRTDGSARPRQARGEVTSSNSIPVDAIETDGRVGADEKKNKPNQGKENRLAKLTNPRGIQVNTYMWDD